MRNQQSMYLAYVLASLFLLERHGWTVVNDEHNNYEAPQDTLTSFSKKFVMIQTELSCDSMFCRGI